MATLYEYFKTDFSNSLGIIKEWEIHGAASSVKVVAGVYIDFYSNVKFIAYHVPIFPYVSSLLRSLIAQAVEVVQDADSVIIKPHIQGDASFGNTTSHGVNFSRRIYIYLEESPSINDLLLLEDLAHSNMMTITVRSEGYVTNKTAAERPLAFISHDSRDKATVAHPIAVGLIKLLCPVWYDEFSLTVGDNLRTSIETGLKEARKCILVLSPNFLSNTGWTKTEFDSIFTRELLERSSVILPVWCGVSPDEVYNYSPSLANKFGLSWDKIGGDEVVRRLYIKVKE